jgi:hypothetical protein
MGKYIPIDHKLYQMAIKYMYHLPRRKIDKMATKIPLSSLQDLQKFTQIGIFGLKIYHLATLLRERISDFQPNMLLIKGQNYST